MLKRTIILIFILSSNFIMAQTTISGTIKDMETSTPLGYTNIQVKDSYQGTITNKDGLFTLQLTQMPAILIIRFIGYETVEIEISQDTPMPINIRLNPVAVHAPAIVVTADDPAIGIMAQVIKKKAQWRKDLSSYKAEAYTRAVLENDTSIVSISESTSEVFWHAEKGSREVVHSRRETSNITADDNFAFAGFIPNLLDDDIEIMQFRMIGPTHPDALRHYHFKMTGERRMGDKTVVDIKLWPKNKLQPTFTGRISILWEDKAVIDMDVKPNDAMLFPVPIQEVNMHFRQQYSNFGGKFWFPVDVRIEGELKIGMTGLSFPAIKYSQVSGLTRYVVNQPLPDSLYAGDEFIIVDSLASQNDSLLIAAVAKVPLTVDESTAYSTLDSTMTLARAFKPSGPLARFVDIEVSDEGDGPYNASDSGSMFKGFSPAFLYNRVDGIRLGATWERRFFKRIMLKGHGGYSFGLKRGSGGAEIESRLARRLYLDVAWANESAPWQGSWNLSQTVNSILNLSGGRDHFDWLWRKGWKTELSYKIPKIRSSIKVGAQDWTHEALDKTSEWGIFNKNRIQRANPAPLTSQLRTLNATWVLGGEYIPWGTVGNNRFELRVEHSNPDIWQSDADYTRFDAFWEGRLPTFLRRRFLPLALDFRVTAGTSTGILPTERLFTMDGRIGAFTPFGTFRTLKGGRLQGDTYIGIFWEHHFRTVPFEIVGLRSLAKKGLGILLHGASGRTWLDAERQSQFTHDFEYWNEWKHEIGLSLTGIFDIFRFDLTKRIGGQGLWAGISVARIF
ncbi:carboxypeptidase-like regulatory domain-containing protein [bacterium]|nr:carboxypeptidase-like regulatory domain-containing protein [bacterium]